jgi:death-on-curing family protein
MTIYPSIEDCVNEGLFGYIRKKMAKQEPAPFYEEEQRGIDNLESIFQFMKRDEYNGVLHKAAYLFCSIIDGHHFSNGNKRLAVTLILYFLLFNDYQIHSKNIEVMKEELMNLFPNLKWDEDAEFQLPHEYFFYHLALIIADRNQKGNMTFSEEHSAVVELLKVVVV